MKVSERTALSQIFHPLCVLRLLCDLCENSHEEAVIEVYFRWFSQQRRCIVDKG